MSGRGRQRRRVGVLGGTFDPVHHGHLAMARAAQRACGLERIYFVPAPRPWHRQQQPVASFADRYAMLALALAGRPDWRPLAVPERGRRPTYTLDQLDWIAAHDTAARLTCIVGADSLLTLPTWHAYRKLLLRCDWAVLARPGTMWEELAVVIPPELVRARGALGLELRSGASMRWIKNFHHGASATAVRRELSRGRASRQAPKTVMEFALRADLYKVERNG